MMAQKQAHWPLSVNKMLYFTMYCDNTFEALWRKLLQI